MWGEKWPKTTTDVANLIGFHRSTVSRVCNSEGIGRLVGGRRLLWAEDVERLRGLIHPSPGNPGFRKKEDVE